MAQGVAYIARMLGLAATVLLPEDAAATKVRSLERMGARIHFLADEKWWQVLADHGDPGIKGLFIHPVASPDVIARNHAHDFPLACPPRQGRCNRGRARFQMMWMVATRAAKSEQPVLMGR